MKKIFIAFIFTVLIVFSFYLIFNYNPKQKNNSLKAFNELVSTTALSDQTQKISTARGIIASDKSFNGKIFFADKSTTVANNSFDFGEIKAGYYAVSLQDTNGKYYSAVPANIQILTGSNYVKIGFSE